MDFIEFWTRQVLWDNSGTEIDALQWHSASHRADQITESFMSLILHASKIIVQKDPLVDF